MYIFNMYTHGCVYYICYIYMKNGDKIFKNEVCDTHHLPYAEEKAELAEMNFVIFSLISGIDSNTFNLT